VALLTDLCELALRDGADDEFARRLAVLRGQHLAKRRFIERLDAAFVSPSGLT
jgi:hypothetical protein